MTIIHPFPPFDGYTWSTPVVPKLYWDVYSQEQRIKALCMEYAKLIAYNSDLADTLNNYIEIVDTLQEQLPELVNEDVKQEIQELVTTGQFAEMVQQAIDKIAADIDAEVAQLKTDLSNETINRANADNDLSLRIDTLDTDVSNQITNFENRMTPAFQYGIANTQNGHEFMQYDGSDVYRKYLAMGGFAEGFAPKCLDNPLPLLYVANTYRTATDLVYGNDYTATNVNDSYSGWEPAYNHPVEGGKFNIDCTTFVLLAASKILYANSTYKSLSGNIFRANYIVDFFNDVTKNYMNWEYRVLGQDPELEPEHRRLLASEFALMLDDMGMLVKLPNLSATALASKLYVGDIVFYSNTTAESHYMGIGHCAIVVFSNLTTGDIVVIESSTPRSGEYNDTVVYHKLTELEQSQIKCKVTPPQYKFDGQIDSINALSKPSVKSLTAAEAQSFTFRTVPGTLILRAGSSVTNFAVNLVFEDDNVGTVSFTRSLGENVSDSFYMPCGITVQVTADVTGAQAIAASGTIPLDASFGY